MLETKRLLIRPFTPDDLASLINFRTDPRVSKYLGGGEMQNPKALKSRLDFYIGCYEKHGFGMCAMIWKDSGEMIGASGLQPLENSEDIEVGYSLSYDFWGKGLATECAKAWLKFGFNEVGLDRIVAVAQPENKASWHVMEKLGMKFEKNEKHYGFDCVFYAISKKEFLDKFGEMT
jgi:ribosomal-protein-alanine N-acetyltransferase